MTLPSTLLLCLLCLVGMSAHAAIDLVEAFPELRFQRPVLLTHAPDQSNRLYVVEQGGSIRVFPNRPGASTAEVFFDIRKATANRFIDGGEQGLLGLAFDPNFSRNGRFYVNYTAAAPRRTVIARYELMSPGHSAVNYESETVLLEVPQDYSNHNGGMIAFGPDGYLYIGMGDGGSGGDPRNRAQDMQSLLGKMLRIDTNGKAPADNPFSRGEGRPEIWALGLRNPWRFSFDRVTGQLWAGDVGQNAIEEINLIEAGKNYGWRAYEGNQIIRQQEAEQVLAHQAPIFAYSHREGQSVTGGVIYRGADYPALQGWYFFADFVSGQLWGLDSANGATVKLARLNNPAAFGEDEAGEVYVVSYTGKIFRIRAIGR